MTEHLIDDASSIGKEAVIHKGVGYTRKGNGKTKKVHITDFIGEPLQPEREVLQGLAEVVALQATCEQDLMGKIQNADALMLYHFLTLSRETIEALAV